MKITNHPFHVREHISVEKIKFNYVIEGIIVTVRDIVLEGIILILKDILERVIVSMVKV